MVRVKGLSVLRANLIWDLSMHLVLQSNLKQQSAVSECAQALCHEELAAACLMSLGL